MTAKFLQQQQTYPFQLPLRPWWQRKKIPWTADNTPALVIYNSEENLRLKFSLNFTYLIYLCIYQMKLVFDLWQGGNPQ